MTAEESTRTTRWLLRQLEEAIGHHLKSACKHRKYGTILYRAGGDLLHALSSALGSKCTSTDDQSITLQSSAKIPLEEAIQVVGEEMNGKIHQLAGIFLAQEQFDYRMIQFDQLIESTDTQLWRLITMMTASKKISQKHYTPTQKNSTILLLVHTAVLHKQSLLHAGPCPTNRRHQGWWRFQRISKDFEQVWSNSIRGHTQSIGHTYIIDQRKRDTTGNDSRCISTSIYRQR